MLFWINFLLWCFGILWIGFFFAMALEPRWEKAPRWLLAVGFTLFCLPEAYLKITSTATPWFELLALLAYGTLLLYILIPFKDRIWKKILLFILFSAITYISEILCKFLAGNMDTSFDPSFNSPEMVWMVATNTTVLIIFSALLLMIWNRFVSQRTTPRRTMIFFIFPFSQLVTLYALNDSIPAEGSSGGVLGSVGILAGFLSDLILLYILVEQGQKEALAMQLQELETLHQVEQIHYQAIEARREEMAKLRHDFNNQLVTAYHLAEQGEMAKMRALLDAVKAGIAGTGEYPYCGNAVVNAVLNEKAAACQARGIRLETELELGEIPSIQPIHMCSIFTNLLDNAIHAAEKCPEPERFILLKSARKEDYLHIKVENSALETKKAHQHQRKGYGQEILRDIALRYGGEFQAEWNSGIYCAMLALTVVE
ncbi:GHKL domain-containing protein [Anoxybacterium hadale]|uniref:GHKL domain-containing protein n=1 Tax=Anoxybacterium hadale TaxID=3408580 RepID=A0ACD1AEP9_9FIRM|nr:GHKL domain-containing protein [Clostridiales bacterium]